MTCSVSREVGILIIPTFVSVLNKTMHNQSNQNNLTCNIKIISRKYLVASIDFIIIEKKNKTVLN